MVGRVGFCEPGELAGTDPVKLTGVDDDTTDGGSMSADELGCRVDNDISTVLDGSYKVRCSECIIYYKGNIVLVGDLCDSLDIDYF